MCITYILVPLVLFVTFIYSSVNVNLLSVSMIYAKVFVGSERVTKSIVFLQVDVLTCVSVKMFAALYLFVEPTG